MTYPVYHIQSFRADIDDFLTFLPVGGFTAVLPSTIPCVCQVAAVPFISAAMHLKNSLKIARMRGSFKTAFKKGCE